MRACIVLVVVVLCAAGTGCGGGGDRPRRAATTARAKDGPARAAVQTAVLAYLTGLRSRSGASAACAHLTASVQRRIERRTNASTCARAVPAYAAEVGRRRRDRVAHVRILRVDVRGTSAGAVLVDPRAPARVNHRLPLVRRGDAWLVDEAWAGHAPRQDLFEGCLDASREAVRRRQEGPFWRRQPKDAVREFARRYCDAAERRGWVGPHGRFISPEVAQLAAEIAKQMAGEGLIDAPTPDTPVA